MEAKSTGASRRILFKTTVQQQFHRVLRARVGEYFATTGADRYADAGVALKAMLLVAVGACAYAVMNMTAASLLAHVLAWVVFGQAILPLAMGVSHDAAHHALTGHRRIDDIIHATIFGLLGSSGYLWQMRHVQSHHVFPNVNGCDIDIDETFFVRLSPNHARRPHHRAQHIYAPLLYLVVHAHSVLYQDFVYLLKRRLANMTDIRHAKWRYAEFAFTKIAYAAIVFAVPIISGTPLSHALVGLLAMSAGISVIFVCLLIGTHFCRLTDFPMPGPDGVIGHSWAIHALATSVDWNPESRLANILIGGFNAHAAHHLFPTVSHIHYVEISRIIRRTTAEFGVRYNATTLPRLMASHFAYLRDMGRAAPAGAAP
jgi:linoleoyl-CoA desaturase